jgi:hypothetical protein
MKIATFLRDGEKRVGLIHSSNTAVFDLVSAAESSNLDPSPFRSMLDLIDAGDEALESARSIFEARHDEELFSKPLSATKLLAPLPLPRQMRDAMTFPIHILQGPRGSALQLAREKGDVQEIARLQAEPFGRRSVRISRETDLLHYQPIQRGRPGQCGEMATVQ